MAQQLKQANPPRGRPPRLPADSALKRREVASARTDIPAARASRTRPRRSGPRRSTDFATRFDADPAARVIALHRGRVLLAERVEGSAPTLEFLRPSAVPGERLRLLSRTHGRPGRRRGRRRRRRRPDPSGPPSRCACSTTDAAGAIEPEAARWAGPAQPPRPCSAIVTPGCSRRRSRSPTGTRPPRSARAAGRRRPSCRRDGRAAATGEDDLLFPRTDPAVIVLVTDDDDRVLLGSNALWEQHRFSLLAGFVEPGESLEAAVVREVGEEAGVARRPRRVPRQPAVAVPRVASWSASARASPTAPRRRPRRPTATRSSSCAGSRRDELAAAARGDRACPGGTSIAARLARGLVRRPDPESTAVDGDVRDALTASDPLLAALDDEQRRGGRGAARPGVRARGCRHRQDARHHAPHRLRRRVGRVRSGAGHGAHLHDTRRGRAARPAARARRRRRAGAHLPRGGARAAQPLLAARRRRLGAARARVQGPAARRGGRGACGCGSTPTRCAMSRPRSSGAR